MPIHALRVIPEFGERVLRVIYNGGDTPKLTQADFDRASFMVAGKPATKLEWQAAVRAVICKERHTA